MSERKVLNKYYPPDYDPALIPKLRLAKDRQYVIRVMAPFHMRCKTCGNYIYKGTKFNSRKETVQDEDYLGLRIFRFYIKCTRCVAEITFKTDPENQDYSIEHGATRNFEAEKLLEQQEKEIQRQKEEDEGNPMKLLEMRTRDSKREMELMENLEELRDLSQRKAKVNYEGMLQGYRETEEERQKREIEEDEKEVEAIFGRKKIRRIEENEDSDEESVPVIDHKKSEVQASDILISAPPQSSGNQNVSNKLSSNRENIKKKAKLLGIVKKKTNNAASANESNDTKSQKNTLTEKTPTNPTVPAGETTNCEVSKEKTITKSQIGGLGLLGSYGSDSSSEDDQN